MAATPAPLTKLQCIDLVHGKFGQTDLNDLKNALEEFKKSNGKHLAVFFHGGLVSRSVGLAEAALLIDGYRSAGAYPFFFIWNSDLLTALQGWLFPFAENMVVRRVVERHIQFFSAQLFGLRGLEESQRNLLSAVANLRRDDRPPRLTILAALGRLVDSIWTRRSRNITLPPPDQAGPAIQEFEESLARDVSALGRFLAPGTLFTRALGGGILRRLWARFRTGHDHGLYTTLIEEIAIAIGLDGILAPLWESMQNDIQQAFQNNRTVYGGTAFLDCLSKVCNAETRLTLIAHSGGTVYIDRMLNAMDQGAKANRLPTNIKADIVFIAAALSFHAFAATISTSVFHRRVRTYRFFALQDDYEGGYWEVPGVYDKSLLYLLSALCEPDQDADKALVGMERYWSGDDPYKAPPISTVTTAIAPSERVWSPTGNNAQPGFRADARQHGGFPIEKKTDESVQVFLS